MEERKFQFFVNYTEFLINVPNLMQKVMDVKNALNFYAHFGKKIGLKKLMENKEHFIF